MLLILFTALIVTQLFLGYTTMKWKRAEAKLKDETEKFDALVNAVPVSISWINSDHEYINVNEKLAELVGINRVEFIGKKVGFHGGEPSYIDFVNSIFSDFRLTKKFQFDVVSAGQVHNMLSISQKYNDGKCATVIGVDVTQQKQAEQIIYNQEQALIASARLSTLGEMAGAIGHEINNPLTIILGNINILRSGIRRDQLSVENVELAMSKIEATTQRIAKIVRGLKSFAREGSKDPFVPTSVKIIIDETVELCSQRFKYGNVNFLVGEYDQKLEFECQQVQVQQVLLNLVNNAYDVVSELEEKWVRIEISNNEEEMVFRVSDSGKGVDKETERKIFEPFFTTKSLGKGTGMGLSISAGIISQHHGELYIDHDEPNTCFVFRIPLVYEERVNAA